MNVQLNLTLDVVNTALTALGQLQGAAQNALATISLQAKAQLNPEPAAEASAEEVAAAGTD